MRDYTRELDVVKYLLLPGMPPLGMAFGWEQPENMGCTYLGTADVTVQGDLHLDNLPDNQDLKDQLIEAAKEENCYNEWNESITLESGLFSVEVSYPFEKMRASDQAIQRLCVLFFNSYGVLNGEMHNWACEASCDLCGSYFDKPEAQYGAWEHIADNDSDVLDILVSEKIDLSPWARSYESVASDPPEKPPLAWVQKNEAVALLFGKEASEEDDGTLEMALACAIQAVVETQPEHWDKELFLLDIQSYDLPTFEEIRDRAASRLRELPELASFAKRAGEAKDFDALRECMDDMSKAAPAMGIWLITM